MGGQNGMGILHKSREESLIALSRLMNAGVRAQVELDNQSILLYRLGRRSDKLLVQYEGRDFRLCGNFIARKEIDLLYVGDLDTVMALLKKDKMPGIPVKNIFINILYVYQRAAGAYIPANSEIFVLREVNRRQYEFMSLDGRLVGEGVNVWQSQCRRLQEEWERWGEMDTPPAVKVEADGKETALTEVLPLLASKQAVHISPSLYVPWNIAESRYGLHSLEEMNGPAPCEML